MKEKGGNADVVETKDLAIAIVKVLVWNVAGVRNKGEEFWDFVNQFDVVGLVETWAEDKDGVYVKKNLDAGKDWKIIPAKRESRKGRAKGGLLFGINRKLIESGEEEVMEQDNMMTRSWKCGERKWKMTLVYNGETVDTMLKKIEVQVHIERSIMDNIAWMIIGDLNTTIGEETWQGMIGQDEGINDTIMVRKSKDNVCTADGRKLLRWTEENGMDILNGSKRGDENGEWTFTGGRGNSVIDYAIANRVANEEIEEFQIGCKVESDHQPLELCIRSDVEIENKRTREGDSKFGYMRYSWNEVGIETFRRRLEEEEGGEKELKDMQDLEERWKNLKEKIMRARKRKRRKGKKHRAYKKARWWDKECEKEKKALMNSLKRMQKAKREEKVKKGIEYRKQRGKYKAVCRKKKRNMKEREWNKLTEIRTEKELWGYINEGRKKKKEINVSITLEEWREHFCQLLEGEEGRVVVEDEKHDELYIEDSDTNIELEEVRWAITKLKKEKAPGSDELENEVWMYATEETIKDLWRLCRRVWNKHEMPEDWRTAVICPIHKGGKDKGVHNYRGISLLATGYKIYAIILEERLRKWAEENGVLPEEQAGFRRGRGVMDNIYVLHNMIESQLKRKRGKLYAFYVDLKAAFDMIDRKLLLQKLRKLGLGERIVSAINNIYKETINVVKINDQISGRFWTKKGVRQGCPLSPILFNLFMADVGRRLEGNKAGGVVVGGGKIYFLAYADDMVFVALEVRELQEMMNIFKKYCKENKLELNVTKSKVQVFKKGGRRSKKERWRWGDNEIEVVNQYKYLGYIFTNDNSEKAHVRFLTKKAASVMAEIWGIGERKFPTEFGLRMKFFETVVRAILFYGVEIWGWKKQEELERIQVKYLKWVLGLNRNTPAYIVQEEGGWEDLWVRSIKRAYVYQLKIKEKEEASLLGRTVVQAKKDVERKEYGRWREKVNKTLEEIGISSTEVGRLELEEQPVGDILAQRVRDISKQIRRAKIQDSRYNKWYKEVAAEGKGARYLKDRRINRKEQKLIARFRCGNEVKANEFWKREEDRMCRLCGEAEETEDHVMWRCKRTGYIMEDGSENEKDFILKVLKEDGQGLNKIKRIMEEREVHVLVREDI